MKGAIERPLKALILIGVTFIALSFLLLGGDIDGRLVDDGEWEIESFVVQESFYFWTNSDNGEHYSLYILDYNDTLNVFEQGSLRTISPTLRLENITEWDGMVVIPSPGLYTILITQSNESQIRIHWMVSPPYPRPILWVPGVVMMSPGVLYLIGLRVIHTQRADRS